MVKVKLPVLSERSPQGELSPPEDSGAEIAPRHDFLAKLMQPSVIDYLKNYMRWQVEVRQSPGREEMLYERMPDASPISINLDPTSACNYACGHCVDMDILNTGTQYDYDRLRDSLDLMHRKGLRSVIIIGGGEPTLYREFEDLVRFIKERDMQVAVVTNGTGMRKISNVGHLFGEKDWVRLSLDSGTDATFQAMHEPKGKMLEFSSDSRERVPITLERICEDVKSVRAQHPNMTVGFSYIITWKGAFTNDRDIVSNIDEMVSTTQLARDHDFSYISFKPFLSRASNNQAEVVGIDASWASYNAIIVEIQANVVEAKKLETPTFKVVESTNLRVLENGTTEKYREQPENCHMSALRQVLGIRGIAICPVYRGEHRANIGDMDAYSSNENHADTRIRLAERIRHFNAKHECKDVTCLYNPANWFIENIIQAAMVDPRVIDELQPGPDLDDYFL